MGIAADALQRAQEHVMSKTVISQVGKSQIQAKMITHVGKTPLDIINHPKTPEGIILVAVHNFQ